MAKVTLLNGGTGADHRGALNNMFTELYEKFVAATALADGYLTKEDFATFTAKQDALVAATALADGYLDKDDFAAFAAKQDALDEADETHDGILTKEDWATFNGKQDALTDPVTLVVAVPASATDTGVKGQVAIDAEYIYLCTTPDTWVRAPLAFDTWGEG